MRCTSIVFRAMVHCCVVCSIVSLANPVRRYERCRSNPIIKTRGVVLNFWVCQRNLNICCDYSNETSSAVFFSVNYH